MWLIRFSDTVDPNEKPHAEQLDSANIFARDKTHLLKHQHK